LSFGLGRLSIAHIPCGSEVGHFAVMRGAASLADIRAELMLKLLEAACRCYAPFARLMLVCSAV
jgi:hypothetical protein